MEAMVSDHVWTFEDIAALAKRDSTRFCENGTAAENASGSVGKGGQFYSEALSPGRGQRRRAARVRRSCALGRTGRWDSYSCRKASMGSSLAAFWAGYQPKNRPTPALKPTESRMMLV